MGISSSLVAPSAIAVLSTVLLNGTAASQTATSPTNQLPSITVQAPKQADKAGGKTTEARRWQTRLQLARHRQPLKRHRRRRKSRRPVQ